jgi:hypothetical protein
MVTCKKTFERDTVTFIEGFKYNVDQDRYNVYIYFNDETEVALSYKEAEEYLEG